jgi:Ser/Thr protein kinase RdoA (MazF antagonist)
MRAEVPLYPSAYARPRSDEEAVRVALARLGVDREAQLIDLGGTMSLNLHLVDEGLVLRVHPRFVTRERLRALQAVRAHLAGAGLEAAEAVEIDGSPLLEVGDRVAEVERFLVHETPTATWESYAWMFESMGRLHRALAGFRRPVPAPLVATYGVPSALRAEAALTAVTVQGDLHASAIANEVVQLVEALHERWIEASTLPRQLIHGDVRLGNVARSRGGEPAFFDFGFAARRPRVHDLAYALSWMVLRPDDSGRAEDFPWDRVPDLVAAYEYGCRNRLLPVERTAVAPSLAAVPLHLAAVSRHTSDPVAHLQGERPFIEIARWVLANTDEITRHLETTT